MRNEREPAMTAHADDRQPAMTAPADGREPTMTADADGSSGTMRLDATVIGRVQGVGYRWFVLAVARRLHLPGWVLNEADGSVRCVAEGPRPVLESLLHELATGPLNADVERVVPRWGPAAGLTGLFEIRSGAHSGD